MTVKQPKPTYHVRHDLQPRLTQELLILLWDKHPCKADALYATASERGYRLAERSLDQLIASLGNLDLIERGARGAIRLSTIGGSIAHAAKYQPSLVPELIHLRYYTLYDDATQANRFSWAYRSICENLWEGEHKLVNSHRLITLIQERAQAQFDDFDVHGVSFSQNSVNGVLNWLEALDPPCIKKTESGARFFSRRAFCPPETMLLALKYVHAQHNQTTSSQLQLTHQVRTEIACACLLDPDSVTEMLEIVAEAFNLIYRQSERGEWISLPSDRSPVPSTNWFAA